MKFATALLLLGVASAEIEIEIDDEKIGKAADSFGKWANKIGHTAQGQSVAKAFAEAHHHAQVNDQTHFHKIIVPVVRNIKTVAEVALPDPEKCNADQLATCLLKTSNPHTEFTFDDVYGGACATASNCHINAESLTDAQLGELETAFKKNCHAAHASWEELGQMNSKVWQEAFVKEQQNIAFVATDFKKEAVKIMKDWGCDSHCAYYNTSPVEFCVAKAIEQCSCPSAIDVDFEYFSNITTEEAQALAARCFLDEKANKVHCFSAMDYATDTFLV